MDDGEDEDAINQVISRMYPTQDPVPVEQDITLTLDIDDFYRLWVSRMPDAFVYLHSLNDQHLSIIRSTIEEDDIDTLRRQLKSICKQRGKTNEIDELALESLQFHEAFLESVIAWNERNFEIQYDEFEEHEASMQSPVHINDISDEEDVQFETLPIQLDESLSSEKKADEGTMDLDDKVVVSDEEDVQFETLPIQLDESLSSEKKADEDTMDLDDKVVVSDEEAVGSSEDTLVLEEQGTQENLLEEGKKGQVPLNGYLKVSDEIEEADNETATVSDDDFAVIVDEDDDDIDIHFSEAPKKIYKSSPQDKESVAREHLHIDIQQSLLLPDQPDLEKKLEDEITEADQNKEEIQNEQIQIGYNSEDELEGNIDQEDDEFARFVSDIASKDIADIRNNLQQDLEELNQAQKKNMGNTDDITGQMIKEIQELLKLFGIPYMVAPMEAEAQCAELESLALVDGTITDDSDVFLFGAGRVYKNMFNQQRFVECYHSKDIDREMLLNRRKLIQLAFLLGSDYTDGIPGVGPVTAMEILFEFSTTPEEPLEAPLQKFRDWYNGHVDDTPFQKKFRKQHSDLEIPGDFPDPRVKDAYYNPTVDKSTQKFEWGQPQLDSLRVFLTEAFGWSEEKADEVLLPVLREMNSRKASGEQQVISTYFNASGHSASSTNTHKHSSKRVQNIVEKWRKQKKPKNA
ncbi:hypothetical protein INT47_004473 [Mucor saturninus]|uniref:XPG-I domain-containing protein n=1 Tax=Mucor saturninus TaxID=64648 RepID=A0A8H7UTT9_9FUNG|nr:hypothetical protein INT47_004473 [Mucor saturninus]